MYILKSFGININVIGQNFRNQNSKIKSYVKQSLKILLFVLRETKRSIGVSVRGVCVEEVRNERK